jgi:hypothetical protein
MFVQRVAYSVDSNIKRAVLDRLECVPVGGDEGLDRHRPVPGAFINSVVSAKNTILIIWCDCHLC